MKKIVSIAALCTLISGMANAAPAPVASQGLSFTETVASWFSGSWYMGGRAGFSILHWKNRTSSTLTGVDVTDEPFTETVFGGAAFVGHQFTENWRGEVEAGLIGNFEEEEDGTTFKLSAPYITVNAMYDFKQSEVEAIYLGGGFGFAMPKTDIQSVLLTVGDSAKSTVSPMFSLMAGMTFDLNESLVLDLRYRVSMLFGPKHERGFIAEDYTEHMISNEIGLILDNSVSVGLRYEF